MPSNVLQTPFARAIDSFLADVRRNEDFKSPFYKEVLSQLGHLAIQDGSNEQSRESANDLSTFIEGLEQKKAEGKTVRIAEKLRPLVTGLAQYTNTIDILIQAGPAATLVLYCGARLVLQLAQGFYSCFDTVLDIMAEIGHLLRCYEKFSTGYRSSVDIQELLVESYKNIVFFWQKAAKLLSRKAYKTILIGLIKPLDAEWQKCRLGLDRDCRRIQALAQATESELQRNRDLNIAETQQEAERRQIVNWLNAGEDDENLDVRVHLRTNLERHQKGTCEWLYDHPKFQHWYESTSNVAIWYHAGPGTGKTIMSSALTKHLQDQGLKTAHFFFSFDDPSRRKLITALRSLARQLLSQSDSIPDQVLKLYKADVVNHVFALRDQQTAATVLKAFLNQSPRIHVIIDGLDECFEGHAVPDTLASLISTPTHGLVKWFFTSRDEQEIRLMTQIVRASEIVPSMDIILSDIRMYLHNSAQQADLDICCVDHWASASEGNFLWMKLMIDILKGLDLTCEEDIEEELQKFPKGLSGCYLRTLEQFSKRSEQQQEFARRIFTILVVAEQPLHLSELSCALGIRENTKEYSGKRIPKRALIEDICAHLVIFDSTAKGSTEDPLLKLIHKSVQDFFIQDPVTLRVPSKLHKFFVNRNSANLEVGKACLTYLSYDRYQDALDLSVLDNDPEREHAFLKYAATFWFWHLMKTKDSKELFILVERFIQSPAFWTCLTIQCKFTPHLVAPLTEVARGGFSLGTGPGGSDDDKVHFAFPLPSWLDEYSPTGPIIVQQFLSFIKEWHPTLTGFPPAIGHCSGNVSGSLSSFSHNPSKFKGVRVYSLLPKSTSIYQSSQVCLQSIRVEGDEIYAVIVEQENGTQRQIVVRRSQIGAKKTIATDLVRRRIQAAGSTSSDLSVAFTDTGIVSTWELDFENLNLFQDNGSSKETFKAKLTPKSDKSTSKSEAIDIWTITSKNRNSTSYGDVFIYHCSMKEKVLPKSNNSNDSGYGTSDSEDSDYDSESESDEDEDEEEKEEDEDEDLEEVSDNNQCLVIISKNEPIWFPWEGDVQPELIIIPAVHPSIPLAVWSHGIHEFRIANLLTKSIQEGILPEPVDVQLRATSAIRKEFRFSRDGKILHYLLSSSTSNATGTTCSISVSSFNFAMNDGKVEDLKRPNSSEHIAYQLCNSNGTPTPSTSILTHWAPDYLYVALPSLTCDPKIIRIPLSQKIEMNSTASKIQTLESQIYFPSSTPTRNPKLFIYSNLKKTDKKSPKASEYLILALDPGKALESNHDTSKVVSPIMMRWSISKTNNWRDWDVDVDEQSAKLRTNQCTYEMLRGGFVDVEQRFSIPIRSGLDWRKKAFVSCM